MSLHFLITYDLTENNKVETYFVNWLKEKDLMKYAEMLSEQDAEVIYKKFTDKFIDFSFVKELREFYGDEEINRLPLDALIGSVSGKLDKRLITLTESYWISSHYPINESAHRKRVKELIFNKKSFVGKKVYWHLKSITEICLVDYSNLDKFIDAADSSTEYYIFDDSLTWCLAVNHEYYIVVCGGLLKKH